MKKSKSISLFIAILILAVGGYFWWDRVASPTQVALVNFPSFMTSPLMLSNSNSAVRYRPLETEEFISNRRKYDFVLLFGMGLKLDEKTRAEVKKYAERQPLLVFAPTGPENTISSLDSLQEERVKGYMYSGNKKNYRSLSNYIRKYIDYKRTSAPEPEEVVPTADDVFYHIDEEVAIPGIEEFEKYLKGIGYYHEGAPKVLLMSTIGDPYSGNKENIDSVISGLNARGLNVYPVVSSKNRLKFIDSVAPNAVVLMAHGRMLYGPQAMQLQAKLRQLHAPLFIPLTTLSTQEEWERSPMGMMGGFMSQSLVMPELDGAICPYLLNAQEEKGGIVKTIAIPERLDRFSEIVARMTQLQKTPNRDKKVAIFYFKGPGQAGLQAQGLEVGPSLYELLKRMKVEGYTIDLPESADALVDRIMKEGPVLESFTEGAVQHYLDSVATIRVDASLYDSWLKKRLSPQKYQEVMEKYGPAPGKYMSGMQDGKPYVAVAGVQLGNVVLLPQPMSAIGSDDFKIVHGANTAPPHPYLTAYLWAEEAFGADALVHFGTHGSLEFTPQKQVALSSHDWSDALVGTTPHFYYYTIGNVGESMMAKRRSYATLVSYLTPPFEESEMRSSFKTLMNKLDAYDKEENGKLRDKYALDAKKEILRLGIHRDLKLDSIPGKPYTEEELLRVENFAEEIANEKIYTHLYTTGIPYSPKQIHSTVMAISTDPIGYASASLDRELGKLSEENYRRTSYLTRHYLTPAKALVSKILAGARMDSASVAHYGGISMEELRSGLVSKDNRDQKALAIQELFTTIMSVGKYEKALQASPEMELQGALTALSGSYLAPSSGGDAVANPKALPTGRNLYSINAETTPTVQAWEKGKMLAESTLKDYFNKHGEYPRKVSYSFWSSEFIETGGTTLAQVFYMLGVEPVHDRMGRVSDVRLIPSEELGRPRIDVLVQTSGQFRDLAASRLSLITKAVALAANAGSNEKYPNFVLEGNKNTEKLLVEEGTPPQRARELSGIRVFGGINGMYGTGIQEMIFASNKWSSRDEIADVYLNNMGAAYATEESWGEFSEGLFRAAVAHTDVVVHPRQSNTWGALSLDHVFEFMGGLNLTITSVTGKEPDAYFADYRNRNRNKIQELKEAIGVESRSTILNPHFVSEVTHTGGASSAMRISEIVENTFGWEVAKPDVIDDELWNGIYDVWVNDSMHQGTEAFFTTQSPAALEQITGVLLETVRKGMWKASPSQVVHLAEVNARVIKEYGSSGASFVARNEDLREFVSKQLPEGSAKEYNRKINHTLKATQANDRIDKEGMVLEKQTAQSATDTQSLFTSNWSVYLIVDGVLLIFVIVIVLLRRKSR